MATTWEQIESLAVKSNAKFPRLVAAQWACEGWKDFDSEKAAEEWVDSILQVWDGDLIADAESAKEAANFLGEKGFYSDAFDAKKLIDIMEAYVEVE